MTSMMREFRYVICVHNRGYEGSLELRKLYRCMSDPKAEELGMIRVVDDEDEDYLYPSDWFVPADLASRTIRKMEEAFKRSDFSRYFENVPESQHDRDALIDEFNQAMMDVYKKAKSDAGYTATRFLNLLHEHGGLNTAYLLLDSNEVSEGYTALWERGRLDLTVEALVFETVKYHPLFTHEQVERARERLRQYQYQPALVNA